MILQRNKLRRDSRPRLSGGARLRLFSGQQNFVELRSTGQSIQHSALSMQPRDDVAGGSRVAAEECSPRRKPWVR